MVERIKALLAARQLSPTQFADTIGVARPIISHILGGRNKPSLEVVQKIIAAFPDLSLPWLLNGIGDMVAATAPAEPASTPVAAPKRASASNAAALPDRTAPGRAERTEPLVASAAPAQEPPALPTTSARLPAVASPVPPTSDNSSSDKPEEPSRPASHNVEAKEVVSSATPANTAGTVYRPITPQATPKDPRHQEAGKTIRRIVIFYTDGSFADYLPE